MESRTHRRDSGLPVEGEWSVRRTSRLSFEQDHGVRGCLWKSGWYCLYGIKNSSWGVIK
jgi:hypothetical protein